jgi:uncharacterized protein YhaN
MVTKKDVVGLAKTTTKKPAAKKIAAKPVEKKLTAAEERDLKAKAKVEELLQDSPINTLDKKDDLLELDDNPPEAPKGVEWLEEQVTLLNQKKEALEAENSVLKADIQVLKTSGGSNDGEVKKVVIQLFNELQENFIKMGIDNRGMGNFRIYTPGFLNRMIKFFPFLEQHKRY